MILALWRLPDISFYPIIISFTPSFCHPDISQTNLLVMATSLVHGLFLLMTLFQIQRRFTVVDVYGLSNTLDRCEKRKNMKTISYLTFDSVTYSRFFCLHRTVAMPSLHVATSSRCCMYSLRSSKPWNNSSTLWGYTRGTHSVFTYNQLANSHIFLKTRPAVWLIHMCFAPTCLIQVFREKADFQTCANIDNSNSL